MVIRSRRATKIKKGGKRMDELCNKAEKRSELKEIDQAFRGLHEQIDLVRVLFHRLRDCISHFNPDDEKKPIPYHPNNVTGVLGFMEDTLRNHNADMEELVIHLESKIGDVKIL